MNASYAYFGFLLEILTPLAYTVHSENKECNALLLKYCASVFVASVSVRKPPSLFREILHLITRRSLCKSMKLFLSPRTSNSSIGPSEEYDGSTFSVKALSKVISRGCFSKKSSVVCVASAGSKLLITSIFRKEIWPTSRQRLLLKNAFFWLFTVGFRLMHSSCFWSTHLFSYSFFRSRLYCLFWRLFLCNYTYQLRSCLNSQFTANPFGYRPKKLSSNRQCGSANTCCKSSKTPSSLAIVSWKLWWHQMLLIVGFHLVEFFQNSKSNNFSCSSEWN